MKSFFGTHQNRLDAKGRVSIPAPFRAVLKDVGENGSLVLRRSHKYPCIESWPVATFQSLVASRLQELDLFSDEYDDLSFALYADAFDNIEPDREGRIVLPEMLVAHAGLKSETGVLFVGMGARFEIWDPESAQQRRTSVRESGVLARATLPVRAANQGTTA